MKLFKLLYFLDFIHFKQYGTTVTGMEYSAWKMGPVPERLYHEFKEEKACIFKDYFKIIKETDNSDQSNYSFKITSKKSPDMKVFTPNEKKIMEEIAFQFKEATAKDISEITHLKNTPWTKTPEGKIIDYKLALDEDSILTEVEAMERYELEKELDAR